MAGTVTVACKLPNGLQLDLYDADAGPVDGAAPVPVQSVTLRGSRFPRDDSGIFINTWAVSGGEFGYGITENVDADFWAAWSKSHEKLSLVKQGLVFAMPKTSDVMKEAENRERIRSGMESLDKDNPAPGIKPDDGKDKPA